MKPRFPVFFLAASFVMAAISVIGWGEWWISWAALM